MSVRYVWRLALHAKTASLDAKEGPDQAPLLWMVTYFLRVSGALSGLTGLEGGIAVHWRWCGCPVTVRAGASPRLIKRSSTFLLFRPHP
jgi:hypothetical protein